MKIEKIRALPLKQKKFLMDQLCATHNKILLENKIRMQKLQLLGENVEHLQSDSILDLVLELLSKDERLIVETDFLKKDTKKDKHWYRTLWSKNTYYNKKHVAIDKVLYYMNA